MLSRRTLVLSALAAPLAPSLPTPARAATDAPIKLRDLYNRDRGFSDLALSLEGQRIEVEGFMAPPLKAEADFFVLTKMPMAQCPFCEPETEWPDDILAVYTRRTVEVIPFNVRLTATGVLQLGPYTDPATGFWSLVRLGDARYLRA
ncbi:hypothetical protein [Frigidibacter sp. MR17.24]|uniref:hypothetical protein n=1 Tax=Frigidibacter sp. MR17.24 TaxID=3127345 RepID=UPI003012F485